ncbi:WD40 repeat domain-containing protein [Streptomyces ossamyceticus]|uniref:WD40 repeat domain-containing protein n=1 Tax=Streptomyces ossamyceticus TaxID=249581 RepID=UPI0034390A35
MTVVETVARVRAGSGSSVVRLFRHPRLPLVAGLDAERPTVRVWDCGAGRLRELGCVGAESREYGDVEWEKRGRIPAADWHPRQPLLVVAGEDGVRRWTPDGVRDLESVPPGARYHDIAFSPDGGTLWATPSWDGENSAWDSSDVIELASGSVSTGPRWDTGVAEHPAGGLVVTLHSDQGATFGLFARVDDASSPATMRVLRRALVLDVDGYETPVFSTDGRHLAVRGNAYGNSLEVFEFPSLRSVLATTLGDPTPGYPYPQEWLDQMRAWSRQNLAFAAAPGTLWIGTPTGTLVELDVETRHTVEHEVATGSRVTALSATATGELVVATDDGDLLLLSLAAGAPAAIAGSRGADGEPSAAEVAEFLDSTSEVPADGDLEDHLVRTDGRRIWDADEVANATRADETDPTWLQLQAAFNALREQDT